MISCAAPNVNIALAVGPTFLIPLMLFGGLFLQNSTIPVWLEWLKYLSWFMYSNEAMLINQWKGVEDIKVRVAFSKWSIILDYRIIFNKFPIFDGFSDHVDDFY